MMTVERHSLHNPSLPNEELPKPCRSCTIRSLSICDSLSPTEQSQMIRGARLETVPARQIIFTDTEDADHIFSLVRGRVSLSKSLRDGRRHVVRFMSPGNLIGLSSADRYSTTAESLTEVVFCRFPRKHFLDFALQVPALERWLLLRAEKAMVASIDRLFLLGRKTAIERVCSFLLEEMALNPGTDSGQELELPMMRSEIGDHLGLTQETVSRCFTQLSKTRLIDIPGPNRILVRDALELKRLAEAN